MDNSSDDGSLPPISPDFVEQDSANLIDNIIPTRGYSMTPMVALGGSAGGLGALKKFFETMPFDSGMVFVVILHLDPFRESAAAELLSHATRMRVKQAENGEKVSANTVYVIPPGKYLVTVDDHLRLVDLTRERGKRVAVDLFFRSLADTHGPHATAIVLSGADGDGALGVKRIKERGGLTIAQDPDEAEHSSMPQTAINTAMIDWVLRVEDMPARLLQYRNNGGKLKLPSEDGPQPMLRKPQVADDSDGEAALREVLIFLRMRTGRDFWYYKRATIVRRIARRMQVNGVDDLAGYLSFLRTHPGEAGALLFDLLISVTNFFRDRQVFEALKQHIPTLFQHKTHNDSVRVWVPACATGEEAYSIGMLLLEHAQSLDHPPVLQVFACDLDDDAIQTARAGHYPETITADVSDERLRKFFVKDSNGYRVRRELREMVLFTTHDLLKDAPFSRMDLISCRNLLIYLNRDAQQRVFETFHFALKPEGRLLLGSSEAVEDGSPLFRVLDKKHRIYSSMPALRSGLPIPQGPGSLVRIIEAQAQAATETPVVHGKRFTQESGLAFPGKSGMALDRASLAELHFKLIERFGPPSILVNADHEIVHLSERAGEYLRLAGGEPILNLLRVIHPALRIELRTALFRCAESNTSVESLSLPAEIGGDHCWVDIQVSPAHDIAAGFLLVTLSRRTRDESTTSQGDNPGEPETVSARAMDHIERELEQVKSNLRDTVEQYEASTEELKASNEELQAMNEELRSATEELETSREELQSINEELTTVNQEMKGKVDELANANSDLQNLMASTAIATVFLDRTLAITRFTPSAASIFNLIPSDIGRPLDHLKHRLDYPNLIADAELVLCTLVPIEREVRDVEHWYLARIQPYRTPEDLIAGTVLTLVDVTDRHRAIEELRVSEERLRMVIDGAKDYAIFTTDRERRVNSWNKGAEAVFGYSEKDILGLSADVLFVPEDRERSDPEQEVRRALDHGHAHSERWHVRQDNTLFYGSGSVTPLRDANATLRGFLKIIRDLTQSKRTQEELRAQMDELARFNAAAVGREERMIELKAEINELCRSLGEPPRYRTEHEIGE